MRVASNDTFYYKFLAMHAQILAHISILVRNESFHCVEVAPCREILRGVHVASICATLRSIILAHPDNLPTQTYA